MQDEPPERLEADPKPRWTSPELALKEKGTAHSIPKRRGPNAWLSSLIVLLLTLASFMGSAKNGFVNYDDDVYVTENPMVMQGLTGRGIVQAFSTQHGANWHPLTWLSHALDVELYGLEPAGHHLTSVLLHALVALLVLRLFLLLFDDPWLALVGALFWALHPLRVESVSWVSERKDVLSGLFALLSLIAYVGWCYFPGRSRKALVALLLALGLMCKPMLVSLPLVFLLLDAWPLRRLKPDTWLLCIKEKWLFFTLAAAAMALTLATQSAEGAISSGSQLSFLTRMENAQLSLFVYLKQTLIPGHLVALYPHLANTAHDAQAKLLWPALGSLVVFAGLGLWAFKQRAALPWLGLGLAWYIIMSLPILGLVQVGYHAHADRYTYLPSIGLALIVAHAFRRAYAFSRPGALATALIVLGLLGRHSMAQVRVWHDSITLWENALAENPVNLVAHKNLALAQRATGHPEEALKHYALAAQMDKQDASLRNLIGELELELGDLEASLVAFQTAAKIDPTDWTYPLNAGITLELQGRDAQADAELQRAQALDANDYRLPLTLGKLRAREGHAFGAEKLFQRALSEATGIPDQMLCLESLGGLQLSMQNTVGALHSFQNMVVLNEQDALAHYNLSLAQEANHELEAALRSVRRALDLAPDLEAAALRLRTLEAELP